MKQLKAFNWGRYGVIGLCTVAGMAAFTVLRIMLLVREWGSLDHTWASISGIFLAGFIYDLAFVSYACLLLSFLFLLIPNRVYTHRWFGALIHLLIFAFLWGLCIVLFAEWLFWGEFQTRFNFISVDYLIYRREVIQNIRESYPVPGLLAATGGLALLMVFVIKNRISETLSKRDGIGKRIAITLVAGALACFAYLGVNQSLREFFDNNYAVELASNGPYQFVAAFRNNSLDYSTFYRQGDDRELSAMLKKAVDKSDREGGLYDLSRPIRCDGDARPWNVILISVESLSAKYLARFGNHENLTPFLNQWASQGLLFTDFYAVGTRTVRGLEALTLSIPPTPGRAIVKRPDNAHYYSLGKVFKDQGYDVGFFYGGIGFFDNMNAFFSGNGYRIVDRTDFSKNEVTFENAWGVCDEDLYGKVMAEADRAHLSGTPFFFHVMTTSNHRPFTYPEGKIDIPSGTGRGGAVKYTDYSLSRFITASRAEPWFDRTLFVVVADHCSGSAGRTALPIHRYHIPLIIHGPGIAPGEITRTASQIDVAPTLLALLNISYESRFFGRDILADDFPERALIGNYQKLGLYKDDTLVILSPQKRIDMIRSPWRRDLMVREGPALTRLDRETMAYYQGGSYILAHDLNRWTDRPGT